MVCLRQHRSEHACDKVAKHRRICHFIEADRQTGVLAFWTKWAPMAWRRPSAAKATYNGIGPDVGASLRIAPLFETGDPPRRRSVRCWTRWRFWNTLCGKEN